MTDTYVPYQRHANADWKLRTALDGGVYNTDVTHALLMDIRAELRKLNRVLECPNFQDIPHRLTAIEKNTRKPRRKRKVVRK